MEWVAIDTQAYVAPVPAWKGVAALLDSGEFQRGRRGRRRRGRPTCGPGARRVASPAWTSPSCRACVVYDESLTSYDFGPTHPMNPIRVDLTVALAEQLGVLDRLPRVPAPDATEDDLLPPSTTPR